MGCIFILVVTTVIVCSCCVFFFILQLMRPGRRHWTSHGGSNTYSVRSWWDYRLLTSLIPACTGFTVVGWGFCVCMWGGLCVCVAGGGCEVWFGGMKVKKLLSLPDSFDLFSVNLKSRWSYKIKHYITKKIYIYFKHIWGFILNSKNEWNTRSSCLP